MPWTINYISIVEKQLSQLTEKTRKRITSFLGERVATLVNPRSIGAALHGKLYSGLWKYRVGDFRVICKIEDKSITILVIKIGHRREIYKLR